jgi:chromate reductase
MSPAPIRLLGIAGSLRRGSYNRAALRAATTLVPEGATLANQPELMIGNAATRFDGDGNLTDDTTRQRIRELLRSLVDWTRRLALSTDKKG